MQKKKQFPVFFVVRKQWFHPRIVIHDRSGSDLHNSNHCYGISFGLSTVIDKYPSSIVIDSCQSIKIDNFFFCEFDCYRLPISIADCYRLISSVSIDFRYRFLSIYYAWTNPISLESESCSLSFSRNRLHQIQRLSHYRLYALHN